MNSAMTVDGMITGWKRQGLSKAEIAGKTAEAMIGWPYVWGATGQDCTPEKREYFMGRSSIGVTDAENIRKRCQVLNGSHALCTGCKYYPNGARTRVQDCQGFVKEICKTIGITLSGGGCTSMWNDNGNWTEKGKIGAMPSGTICLVFKQSGSTMDHVGLHIGGGQIIHCSGEVKRGKTSEKGWTHYAIPKGMTGGDSKVWRTTIRKGSRGEDVRYCQDILMALGYDLGGGGADGIFGEKTRKAVMEFQNANGLGVDGIVGPKTWEALEKAVGGGETTGEQLYTVTVRHVNAETAEAIRNQYGGEVAAEGGT